ncbi:hypothetical protein B5M09_004798 [Aphanomyces astaci]|uniref:Uncharacterized protein n=1 Tax=Aphanomyces astaci TaxID=112090 RepID=A0A425C3J2_APHAT|nr:hypothetical protein B5M09_004798 [Aphanomyces astaci]
MGRYLFLRDISVVMVYQYAGVLDNGLSFHQLEYRNPSKITPGDLMCALLNRRNHPKPHPRNWPSTQACKPDARRTIQSSRLNTGDLCNWDLPALSFYWRAICYTLHANVRKHRIQKTWDAHCRTCPDSLDTQEHRFGLTHPHRPGSGSLTHDLLLATQARHPQSLAP